MGGVMSKTFKLKFLIILLLFFNIFLNAQTPNTAAAHFERGRTHMAYEDWYSAIESFLECVRLVMVWSSCISQEIYVKKKGTPDILARYTTWNQDSMYSQASAPDGGKLYVHT